MKKVILFFIACIGMMACSSDDTSNISYTKTVKVVGNDYCDGKFIIEIVSDTSPNLSNNERYAVVDLPNEYQQIGSILKIIYIYDEKHYGCPMIDFTYKFITILDIINS